MFQMRYRQFQGSFLEFFRFFFSVGLGLSGSQGVSGLMRTYGALQGHFLGVWRLFGTLEGS